MKKEKSSKSSVAVKDAQDTLAEIGNEPRYRMVPVDMITHKQIEALCAARGMGLRGKGALVRILVKQAFEADKKSGLVK